MGRRSGAGRVVAYLRDKQISTVVPVRHHDLEPLEHVLAQVRRADSPIAPAGELKHHPVTVLDCEHVDLQERLRAYVGDVADHLLVGASPSPAGIGVDQRENSHRKCGCSPVQSNAPKAHESHRRHPIRHCPYDTLAPMPTYPAPTIEDLTARVEAALKETLAGRSLGLYRMMSYHLGWDDAPGMEAGPASRGRSHGVACLVACLAAGGEVDAALPAAAAVELVDGFLQVHDDVQGGQPKRDNRDAVWWVWGPAQAINVGDSFHSLARLALFELHQNGSSAEVTFSAVQMLDEAALDLCEGRFRDFEAQERIDLDVDGYVEMAASKTGALYACSMGLGALAAGSGQSAVDAMSRCGRKLGLALQVRNDVRDVWGGDPSPEVLNKKKLLPVVHAIGKAEISEKRRLGDIYFKRVLGPEDVVALREILEEMGSRQFCEDLAARFRSEALEALGQGGSADRLDLATDFIDRLLD